MSNQQHIDKLFRYQVENHRRIIESLDVLEGLLRNAIATGNIRQHTSLLPLYLFLVGASAEARLSKLLFEPKVFTQDQITKILEGGSQLDHWLTLVRIAFLKQKGIFDVNAKVDTTTVGRTNALLYEDLCNLLKTDLRSVIELRNKMAHGQWTNPFVSWGAPYKFSDLKISGEHKILIKKENLLTLILKRRMIDKILDIVRDLAISHIAFHRDYSIHYKHIYNASLHIRTKSYTKYERNLVSRWNEGCRRRLAKSHTQ